MLQAQLFSSPYPDIGGSELTASGKRWRLKEQQQGRFLGADTIVIITPHGPVHVMLLQFWPTNTCKAFGSSGPGIEFHIQNDEPVRRSEG